MHVSVSAQVYVFLVMLGVGAIAGLLFDIFRVWRKVMRPGVIVVGVGDLIFWITLAVLVFFSLFTVNNGELRWFELLGILLGAAAYFLTLSRLIRRLLLRFAQALEKFILMILKIILTPLLFLYRIIAKLIVWVFSPFVLLFRKVHGRFRHKKTQAVNRFKHFLLVARKR